MVIQVTQSDEDESKKPSKSRPSHKDHHRRRKDDRNEAMEEDDIEAEDLTTKSVSTPLSTPTSTPVPSSSTEKTSSVTNNIMSGSMIGDLMSKFGFSDIQEYQEAYKKALAESGAARAANNNNFIGKFNSFISKTLSSKF